MFTTQSYFSVNLGGGRGTVVAAGLLVNRSSDQSCTRGMIHNRIHLISRSCPGPCLALQCRIVGLKTLFISFLREFAAHNDWSWRIRYTALRALVRLCQGTKSDPNKEGIHAMAYTTLQRAQATEKDNRVLEALKVGQVSSRKIHHCISCYHKSSVIVYS